MKWLWTAILIYILVLGGVAAFRHYDFQTQAWDLGIFNQIMWNITHGNGMSTTLEFVSNHFAVHMSPLLYLLAPGYAAFPSPYFLLIIQTLALALGAWPLYLLAKKNLAPIFPAYAPIIAAAAYLIYSPLHQVNLFDFHPIAFLVTAMLAAFYFAGKKRWGLMFLFLILAAIAQEDAVLVVAFFGIYLILKKEWKVGTVVFLLSMLYFLVSVKFIMPVFGGGLLRIDRYSQLGKSFSEIAVNLFTRPSLFINTIFQWPKFVYLFWIFLPVAFLPFFAPYEFILLVPGLAQNMLTNYAPQFSGAFQYDSTLIAGIFIATVFGLRKATSIFACKGKIVSQILIASSVLVFLLRSPVSPFHFPYELFKKDPRAEAFRQMIGRVPENASVAAHTQIVPHLSGREKIYMLGYEPILEPDILLIDSADYFGFPNPETFQNHIRQYADSGKYSAEIIDDRYYILRKTK